MYSTYEVINPEKAKKFLATSEGNRAINKGHVDWLAKQMSDGNWETDTHQGIAFNSRCCLVDGHHRLNAVIVANTTVTMYTTYGVSDESYKVVDIGYKRTFGQMLGSQRKAKCYTRIAASMLVVRSLRSTGRICENNSTVIRNSFIELFEQYDNDEELYLKTGRISRVYQTKILPPSWVGGLFYFLMRDCGYPENFVETFFSELCSLKESKYSAIELLRVRLIKLKMRGFSFSAYEKSALLIKAWNYYVTGSNTKILRFDREREEYPVIIRLNK